MVTATHISDALVKASYLQKVTFSGTWCFCPPSTNNSSSSVTSNNTSRSVQNKNIKQHQQEIQVLKILLTGLQRNTSVSTLVMKDNANYDRLVGYTFGLFLKNNGKITTVEVLNCKFVGSGLSVFMMSLQHTKSMKSLCFRTCMHCYHWC